MGLSEQKGKLIGQGCTAEIFEWGQNQDKILKLSRKGLPDFLCINEFNATNQIYNQFQICPQAYEIVEIDGRKGAVYEKISGKTMLKEILSKLWTIKKQSRNLAQIHQSMQQKVEFELPTVKEKLKHDINRVPELSQNEKEYLYQYIEELPDGDCLCHFDFHPDNIMFKNGKPVIIDWMTAAKGNPLSDVARTSLLLKYAQYQLKSKTVLKLVNRFRQIIYREYRNEYLKISNAKIEDIDRWEFPIAAARLCEWVPENEKKILLNLVRGQIKPTIA